MDNETQALRVAFEALLPLADPQRQAAILRAGLKSLLIDDESLRNESATTRLGVDAAAEAAKQQTAARWLQIREELRARLQQRYGSLRRGAEELAQAVGIGQARAVRILCPSAEPPGTRVLAAIEDWLNTGPSAANAGSPPEIGVSRSALAAGQREPGTRPQRGPDARSKKPTLRPKTNRSHPEEASADRHRLTATQREKLAAYLELDRQAVRDGAGVTPDVAQRAVSGEYLEPMIVERLVSFLAAPSPGGVALSEDELPRA